MRIAYLDLNSGISGDMMLGALVDAGADLAAIQAGIDSLGLPSCRLVAQEVKRRGYRARKVDVEDEPEQKHRHLHHISDMIDRSSLTPRQRELASRIFQRLAEAEAKVHGTTIRKVHFHEVGAVDSIADIVGTALGIDLLGIERLVSSPVPTGSGQIQIEHGLVGIPAPATAELLRGIPIAPSTVQAELTTPTGAAILAALVDEFGPPPAMKIEQLGYGAGTKDFPTQANLVRLLVGVSTQPLSVASDQVWLLETNLDDVSGELIGHCLTRLWEAGALDVYTTAIQMKKGRPGTQISVLASPEHVSRLEELLFFETQTLGIRRTLVARHKMPRQPLQVSTAWGPVDGKLVTLPSGQASFTPEYESCRAIALQHGVALRDVYAAALQAYQASR